MDWRSAFQSQRLRILHYHLTSLCVEQVVSDLLDNLQQQPADHLVLESARDVWNASRDKSMVRDDLLLFRALFEKAAITTVVVQQVKPIGGDIHDTPTDYSDLGDCVIQLSMAESDGELDAL